MFASQRVLNRFHYSGTYLTRSPRVGFVEKPLPVGTILHSGLRALFTSDPWAEAGYDICHTPHESTVNKAHKLVDSVRLCQLEVVLLRRWRATPVIPYGNLLPLWSPLGLWRTRDVDDGFWWAQCPQLERRMHAGWGGWRTGMGAKPGLPGRSELYQEGCTVRVAKLGRMARAQEWSSDGCRKTQVPVLRGIGKLRWQEASSNAQQAIALRLTARRRGRSKNL